MCQVLLRFMVCSPFGVKLDSCHSECLASFACLVVVLALVRAVLETKGTD